MDEGSRLDRLVPDLLKRGIERGIQTGLTTLALTDQSLRTLGAGRASREVVNYLFRQIDDTKTSLMKAVAKEVRDFLEATDLATEIQKALTTLSFEIRTEIRFIPNEAGKGVKPSVRVRTAALKPARAAKRKREA